MVKKKKEEPAKREVTVDPVHAAGACYCWECKRWKKADCPLDTGYEEDIPKMYDFCSCGEPEETEQ